MKQKIFCIGLLVMALCVFTTTASQATSLYWLNDEFGEAGTGIWDTTTATWSSEYHGGEGMTPDVIWNNDNVPPDIAVFEYYPGTVTVTTDGTTGVKANGLVFNIGGYSIVSAGTETLTLAGSSPVIHVDSGLASINSSITIADVGNVGFTKTGAGTLYVGKNGNTYAGKTVISGGTLSIYTPNSLGAYPTAAVADQITMAGGTTLIMNSSTNFDANRGITLTGNVTLTDASTSLIRFNAPITGSGGITKNGPGELGLRSGSMYTFTGDIHVTEGYLSSTGVMPSGPGYGDLYLDVAGVAFNNSNIAQSINAVNGPGNLTNYSSNTRDLRIGLNNHNGDFSGNIGIGDSNQARLNLLKLGSGTQILRGNDYATGATNVYNGVLKLMNTATITNTYATTISAEAYNATYADSNGVANDVGILDVTDFTAGFTVDTLKTLKGTSSVLGSLIIQGIVAPGQWYPVTRGTLTTQDINFGGTGSLKIVLSGTGLGTGTSGYHDQLNSTGTVTLGATSVLNVSFSSYAPVANDSFDILNWGTLSGTFGTVNLPDVSYLGTLWHWDSSKLYVDGTITIVPEPSTILLLVVGAMLMLLRWRRR